MEVYIALASGKITKNVKYRSRLPGHGVFRKGMSRTITMQGFTFAATLGAEKTKVKRKINKVDKPSNIGKRQRSRRMIEGYIEDNKCAMFYTRS